MRWTPLSLAAVTLALLTAPRWAAAQTVLARWNFNSPTPDANPATGTFAPSVGAGTFTLTGGVTGSFIAGNDTSETGPSPADNTALRLTNFPSQGGPSRIAGFEVSVPNPPPGRLYLAWSHRSSPQSCRHLAVDRRIPGGVYEALLNPFSNSHLPLTPDNFSSRTANVFPFNISSGVTTAWFRATATVNPSSGVFAPAHSSDTYSATGTWDIDQVTVYVIPVAPPTVTPGSTIALAGHFFSNSIALDQYVSSAHHPLTYTGSGPPQFELTGSTLRFTPAESIPGPSAEFVYHYTVTDVHGLSSPGTFTVTVFDPTQCAAAATPAHLTLPCLHHTDFSAHTLTAAPPEGAADGTFLYRWYYRPYYTGVVVPNFVPLDPQPSLSPHRVLVGDGDYAAVVTRTGGEPGCDQGLPVLTNIVPVRGYTADVGVGGGVPGADALHNNNDFIVFITWFFSADPRADIGRQGALLGDDGIFNNNDFIIFINLFFSEC